MTPANQSACDLIAAILQPSTDDFAHADELFKLDTSDRDAQYEAQYGEPVPDELNPPEHPKPPRRPFVDLAKTIPRYV